MDIKVSDGVSAEGSVSNSNEYFQVEEALSESNYSISQRLQKVFVSQYVELAMCMPEVSLTIWNLIERDILDDQKATMFGQESDFLQFLGKFFSASIIETVQRNLCEIQQSSLGVSYTLRYPMGHVAAAVLLDVSADFNSRGCFLGQLESVPESFTGEQNLNLRTSEDGEDGEGQSLGFALQDNEQDSPPNVILKIDRGAPFQKVPQVQIVLSRGLTIRERGSMFVEKLPESTRPLYDPRVEHTRIVKLYHGSRSSSISGFKATGINQSLRKYGTEFSTNYAFNLTNSLKHAFEDPLHQHLSQQLDPVAVLEFEIKTGVLHGDLPFDAMGSQFKVKWFKFADSEWKQFCFNNWRIRIDIDEDEFDVIIGPMCLPLFQDDLIPLKIPGSVPLTQVAFCSKRALRWVNDLVTKIFLEVPMQVE